MIGTDLFLSIVSSLHAYFFFITTSSSCLVPYVISHSVVYFIYVIRRGIVTVYHRLPFDLWSDIFKLALPEPGNLPGAFSKARGELSTVCRMWLAHIYDDPSLWSYIGINQYIVLTSLDFVLSKCANVLLHIRIVFWEFRTGQLESLFLPSVSSIIHSILDRLEHTSSCWESFFVLMEHPEAFLLVQDRCSSLFAPALRNFAACYYLMDGFGDFEEGDPSLCTLPIECGDPLLFEWAFLVELFSMAVEIIAVLDVDFDGAGIMIRVLHALTAYRLVELTLRHPPLDLQPVQEFPSILPGLHRFCLHGMFRDDSILFSLFQSLSHLRILDLTHADSRIFHCYCRWTLGLHLVGSDKPGRYLPSVSLGVMDVATVVTFVKFHGALSGRDGTQMSLWHVRMDGCMALWEVCQFNWLLFHVAQFTTNEHYDTPVVGIGNSILSIHILLSTYRLFVSLLQKVAS
ncbi:hypothetical protein DFH07DRAFT_775057 [Mycena maculata]|uniref:F-box domain-containing protein n=1 Tax=Mycena maculata TaxID=230809 RepID=A0AAD7IXG2_9AGAR|nr:hypothetical protein DFH07DRAFT_775057 [Mycena maculata]